MISKLSMPHLLCKPKSKNSVLCLWGFSSWGSPVLVDTGIHQTAIQGVIVIITPATKDWRRVPKTLRQSFSTAVSPPAANTP